LNQNTENESPDAENSSIISWKLFAGLALMALFLWLSFRNAPMGKFIDAMKKISIIPVLGAITYQIISIVIRGWRWKILLLPSHPELRKRHAFFATTIGYAVNTVIPRGGEIARAVFLKRFSHTSLAAGLSSVVAERLIDVVTLCLLFASVLPLYQQRLEEIFPGVGKAMLAVSATGLIGLVVVWIFGSHPKRAADWLRVPLGKIWPTRAENLAKAGEKFFQGFQGLFLKESALRMLFLTAGIWALYFVANWTLTFAFPLSKISSLSLLDAVVITVVVAISFSLPSPGGTGTTHFFVSQLLTTLYGIDPAEALAYATLLHLTGVIPTLLLGSLFAVAIPPAKPTPGT
jgi:glycosyltransferase 2 family protein